MKTWISTALLLGCAQLSADIHAPATPQNIRTRLCDHWRYDSSSMTYGCNFLGSSVELVSSRELRSLESTIRQLEMRVQRLEQQLRER